MTNVGVDALGQEVREGDTVVAAGGEYNRVFSAGTRYSLGEWKVTKVTPLSFQLEEIISEGKFSDLVRVRTQLRRNHEVVKINDGLVGEFEYGVGLGEDVVVTEGLTKEQAEQWVKNQEDFDKKEDSPYYVIRRAHGTWVKL